MGQISSTLNKGFNITFENGLTISVQFGCGNYCSNRFESISDPLTEAIISCNNAEIAIWDENKKWFNFGSDEVKGYCTSDEVAKWISKTQRAKNIKTIRK